jgi:hypothetical protein
MQPAALHHGGHGVHGGHGGGRGFGGGGGCGTGPPPQPQYNPHAPGATPVPDGQVMMTFPIEAALAGGVIGKRGGATSRIQLNPVESRHTGCKRLVSQPLNL